MPIRSNDANLKFSFKAAADLSTYQFHGMYISAADTVNLSGSNAICIGILQNKPDAAGKGASVAIVGVSQMVVDGSGTPITAGCSLVTDASGHGVITTTDTHNVAAIALAASTAADDVIPVLVKQHKLAG